jgi:hypothetical protein
MKRVAVYLLLLALAAALPCGCLEDLPEIWQIEDTRVIGARIDVAADPERAWVKPGETAEVSLRVVHPDLFHTSDELRMMTIVCTPFPVGVGPPLCLEMLQLMEGIGGPGGEAPDAQALDALGPVTCEQIEGLGGELAGLLAALGIEIGCIEGEPRFEVTVPEQVEAQERLVRGVLCDRGEPFLDPTTEALFGCELQKGGEEIPFALTVPIQTGEETNRHPSLAGASITVDNVDNKDWPTATRQELTAYGQPASTDGEPFFDCDRAEQDKRILQVEKGTRTLRVEVLPADFEPYQEEGEERREELRFAVYATEGKLQRGRSVLQADDKPLAFGLEWETPGKVDKDGTLVRFFFAVRDQRGGFDSTERALCVTQSQEQEEE